jgi:multiple sugar transport system substrate-binding protein
MAQISVSRRRFLKNSVSAAVATLTPAIGPSRARASPKNLKILKWAYPAAAWEDWFQTYVRQWGEANDTATTVDRVGYAEVIGRALAEAERRQGHDLLMLLTPAAALEDSVIDHREIYEECTRRYGDASDFARRSTYNPRTKKHFGIAANYQPAIIVYRQDLWRTVRTEPDSWADVLAGGRRIRLLNDKPVGSALRRRPMANGLCGR